MHEKFEDAARNFDELLAGVWMQLVKHRLSAVLNPLRKRHVIKALSETYPIVSHREDICGFQLVKRPRKLRC